MTKTFSLCAAALLASGGVFAAPPSKTAPNPCACLEQGMGLPTEKKCFPAAYNAPASINVSCGWDVNAFASFIYWHASQENMETAYVIPTVGAVTTPGQVVYQEFEYKPGFKVGIGFNTGYDDWTGWVEYTWLHQSTSNSATPNTAGTFFTAPNWVGSGGSIGSATAVSSKWKMNLDMLDAVFSRPFYQGTQLTISPYAGLRALWIRQSEAITYTSANMPYVTANSRCWSLGPVVGTISHWLLGMGFRFEGKAEGALLYTKYTSLGQSQHPTGTTLSVSTSDGDDYGSKIRPMATLGVGLGWGSYLYCQQYYIDFSARYDFNILWEQNVMRTFAASLSGTADNIGDLALHGLTLSGRFDF